MIEIISSTALCTVQDIGRLTSRRYGVGTAGAMDQVSLAAANLMLGNAENSACIEIPMFPFKVRFIQDCDFSVAGVEGTMTLDNGVLPTGWAYQAKAGQLLSIQRPKAGCRAYFALGGGIDVPVVLGSRSTQLRGEFGGLEGRMLQTGDVLNAVTALNDRRLDFGITSALSALALERENQIELRVIPAAEYDAYRAETQALFWRTAWKITPQSNRYGYRLQGADIRPEQPLETLSHGIVPGVIQIPPGGQPIIQLRDAQPTGGYPKFGTVIEADLWRLGQAAIGKQLVFKEVSLEQARLAAQQNQSYLDDIKQMLALQEIFV
ncbi:biotin-dependent carboxyltransferase family protein [Marinomonas transparens]|uniref:Biotin-dependent carboxyltransferase family protein n=1 Tax=Marinomonas transparens TaxID=2795388 RepID=A0A934MWV8_9GAMM|nr:biotin-dependent carboxyltransferase family protein [Marinomonas transparens]MBJ7538614.1 biotin-dependent carboxyltransferase family protein [Marinomonas transparens]